MYIEQYIRQFAHHEGNHIHLYSFSPSTFLVHQGSIYWDGVGGEASPPQKKMFFQIAIKNYVIE